MEFVFSESSIRDIKPINLGATLRQLREFNGLKQGVVAKALGIDRSTYAYYELGKTRPSYETLIKISDLYDVTLRFLLGQCEA